MSSANGDDTRDLESELLHHPTIYSIDEKQSLKAEDKKKSDKMSKLQHCISTLLLLCLVTVGIVCATMPNDPPQDAAQRPSPEQSRFQELLNAIDPSALHVVLHENMKDKYQHGVFQEDKSAVEVIHQQNAEVAESLIELAKRQATGSGNGTVVTTTAITTTDTIVTSTDSITNTPNSTPHTTPSDTQSSVAPTTSQQTSVPESSTPSSAPSSTVTHVSTSTAPTTSVRASSSESTPVSTTPTPTSKVSTSQSPSQSQAEANTTPSSSRTTIYTTTMANGALTTVTSVTVIPAGQADQTAGGSGASTTSKSNASLQTGGAGRMEVEFGAILGAVGMAVVGAL